MHDIASRLPSDAEMRKGKHLINLIENSGNRDPNPISRLLTTAFPRLNLGIGLTRAHKSGIPDYLKYLSGLKNLIIDGEHAQEAVDIPVEAPAPPPYERCANADVDMSLSSLHTLSRLIVHRANATTNTNSGNGPQTVNIGVSTPFAQTGMQPDAPGIEEVHSAPGQQSAAPDLPHGSLEGYGSGEEMEASQSPGLYQFPEDASDGTSASSAKNSEY
jgi:hypothetical protein